MSTETLPLELRSGQEFCKPEREPTVVVRSPGGLARSLSLSLEASEAPGTGTGTVQRNPAALF